ncbi:MAG: capsular polysaccharide biosynthesis protein [Erysipelotrichia bacterium]|nr:capsular polysaccharide biosynthesis protein [Erysipelotrichia bacterium]
MTEADEKIKPAVSSSVPTAIERRSVREVSSVSFNAARDMGSDAEEIDLVEMFYLLWGNIGKIILLTILGAAMAFGITYFLITPKYDATARMYILSSSSSSVVNLSDLQISNNLRADYQELLLSRPLVEDVISNLQLNYKYKDLESMVSISNPSDTRILNVKVTSKSPQEAADIANELVNQAKIYLPEIMKSDEPSVFESAVVPTQKASPSYTRNTLIGALLGMILCCGVLIVRHLMNDTLVTPDDVYKYIGVQPLSTIPEGKLGSFNQKRRSSENVKNEKKAKKKGKKAA